VLLSDRVDLGKWCRRSSNKEEVLKELLLRAKDGYNAVIDDNKYFLPYNVERALFRSANLYWKQKLLWFETRGQIK
jgi:hypothetical protein